MRHRVTLISCPARSIISPLIGMSAPRDKKLADLFDRQTTEHHTDACVRGEVTTRERFRAPGAHDRRQDGRQRILIVTGEWRPRCLALINRSSNCRCSNSSRQMSVSLSSRYG